MNSLIDVLCIGSAVLDIAAFPIDEQENWKEKQRIRDIRADIGGDAANQAVRLSDLGVKTALLSVTGADQSGVILKGLLAQRGVITEYIPPKDGCQTGTALVLVNSRGERNTFSVEGAHSSLMLADLPPLLKDEGAFFSEYGVKAVSIASIFSMPFLEGRGLFDILRLSNKKGILTFADLSSDKLRQGMGGVRRFLPYIDYFMPSIYDALEMTRKNTAEEAAEVYREAGAQNVIIKMGERGCYYMTAEEQGTIPAPEVKVSDTTGAGDCLNAVFISRILKGEDIKEALKKACLGASLSTEYPGAVGGIITEEMLHQAR